MTHRNCVFCGDAFELRPQNLAQFCCSKKDCQRRRKQECQRQKLKSDPDYRENQARCQRTWLDKHPDYWRNYRSRVAEKRPSTQCRSKRGAQKTTKRLAKMDASTPGESGASPGGLYWLDILRQVDSGAEKALLVRLTAYSLGHPRVPKVASPTGRRSALFSPGHPPRARNWGCLQLKTTGTDRHSSRHRL